MDGSSRVIFVLAASISLSELQVYFSSYPPSTTVRRQARAEISYRLSIIVHVSCLQFILGKFKRPQNESFPHKTMFVRRKSEEAPVCLQSVLVDSRGF
jgi:hypothetical protein